MNGRLPAADQRGDDSRALRALSVVGCGARLAGNERLELTVRPGKDAAGKRRVLEQWYRELLRERIPELLAEWQPRTGVEAAEWRIKRMKTRWGSCNTEARRISLNLELAKKPDSCLEYVLVHEEWEY